MKSPDHPIPSGDRTLARYFYRLLSDVLLPEQQAVNVSLASELRTWEGQGDVPSQDEIRQQSEVEVERLLDQYQSEPETKPAIWVTYHCYHKAPDWIGQTVSRVLQIPYVLIEASVSEKQAQGPWQMGYRSSLKSIQQADLLVNINHDDIPALQHYLTSQNQGDHKLHYLAPFLPPMAHKPVLDQTRNQLAHRYGLLQDKHWILTVARMRKGDKLASYRMLVEIAQNLSQDKSLCGTFEHIIVGDGSALDEVHALFESISDYPVRFLGQLSQSQCLDLMAYARCMVWPGVNEAIGMIYLESMACGLPVVCAAKLNQLGGPRNVVADGVSGFVVDDFNIDQQVAHITQLLIDDGLYLNMSRDAKHNYTVNHNYDRARQELSKLVQMLLSRANRIKYCP